MTSTSPSKPSPLGFGSPRSSPFRRPESPLARSPSNSTVRGITPSASPSKGPKGLSFRPGEQSSSPASSVASAIFSPRSAQVGTKSSSHTPQTSRADNVVPSDPLSKLNPGQLREMRESFQVLDRDNDGRVTREDVADMLGQLGLENSNNAVNAYFPFSTPDALNLSTFLGTLSSLLSGLSRPEELNAAFAAFDVDDSGQIDVEELRRSLLHTMPEKGETDKPMTERDIDRVFEGFTSRRTFGKNTLGRGDVFRYGDFVNEIQGGVKSKDGNVVAA